MPRWPIPAATAAQQRIASNPRRSAWVRANAGSGKTHVLSQRVVRLLLQGVDPAKILCLTFTKAAAANMSMRVFSILSKWTEMDNHALSQSIRSIGVRNIRNLDEARRLFARAVETPGGLKIQTIHAFCERILHLFPFEANVPAHFEAVDDERQAFLMEEAREAMLQTATLSPDSALAQALKLVATEASATTFEDLQKAALNMRATIAAARDLQSNGIGEALGRQIGLDGNESTASVITAILDQGLHESRWDKIIAALDRSGGNDAKLANSYRDARAATNRQLQLESYLDIFFIKDRTPRKGRNGKLLKNGVDDSIEEDFRQEQDRLIPLVDKLRAARLVERTVALNRVADEVLGNYARLKQANGLLDFEDLVERTCNLLTRSDAGWVLYKLDAGIDHILVDEAQDTSPSQWKILQQLVEEFFSGAGARNIDRTFFAVGDEKQSIFSFQGAAPREFGHNAKVFGRQIADADMRFRDVRLNVSFRSSKTILESVDAVFRIPANFKGLSTDEDAGTSHAAWKDDLPGLVEIWDPVGPQEKHEPEDWLMPVDVLPEHAPAAVLAARIARKIQSLLLPGSGEVVHDNEGAPRAIRAGDIMILVRRRNAFFDAVIKALKLAHVPVAGADRLKLMEHIAVMDLVSAGRAALLPDDDFTLACLLKSPLFGFDDDDLLALAPHRKGTLFAELLNSRDPRHPHAHTRISQWGDAARTLGPFRFYAQILGAENGRKKMLQRLGAEAGDAMDEFLRLALQWEHDEASSLTAFLQRMQGTEIEIKRDMEAAGEAVRVMTVHAAKGLEAKIVFLPDTCAAPSSQHDPKLIAFPVQGEISVPVWRKGTKNDPDVINQETERLREEQRDEYRRLLYVAMTRAEERLYISGYHGERAKTEGCWYDMIHDALAPSATSFPAHWGDGDVLRVGDVPIFASQVPPQQTAGTTAAPDWLFKPVEAEAPALPPIRPSQALAAADQLEVSAETGPGFGRELARLEGTLCHTLLQYLPAVAPAERDAAAGRFFDQRGQSLPQQRRDTLTQQILRIIEDPALATLFGPSARAEVEIAGQIPRRSGGAMEISGRIDRLGQSADEVLAVDFKTGRPSPDGKVPGHYLTQMALYCAVLKQLFPGKSVKAFIVWTGGPQIVELPAANLDAALAALTG